MRKISVMPDEQDRERDLVRRLLPLGAFDQRDHAVEEGGAGRGGDPDLDPVGEDGRAAGDGRAVAARLADDRRGFAGDRRFVDRGDALDDLAVGRGSFAGLDEHDVADRAARAPGPSRTRRRALGHAAGAWPPVSVRVRRKRIGLRLAAAFGDRFGEVGEQHGEPEPERDLAGEQAVPLPVKRSRSEQSVTSSGHDLGDEDHRIADQLARIELDEGIAAAAPSRIARSKSERAVRVLVAMEWLRQKVLPASIRKCSTIGPRARAGKNCSPPRIRIMPTSRPTNSGPSVGNVPAEARDLRLGGERAGDRHHRHDVGEAAEQHGDAERRVEPGRVGGEPGEGRAVVAGGRGVGVEDLAQAVRAGIGEAAARPAASRRPR